MLEDQVRNSLQLTFALILKHSKHEVLTVSVPHSHTYTHKLIALLQAVYQTAPGFLMTC